VKSSAEKVKVQGNVTGKAQHTKSMKNLLCILLPIFLTWISFEVFLVVSFFSRIHGSAVHGCLAVASMSMNTIISPYLQTICVVVRDVLERKKTKGTITK